MSAAPIGVGQDALENALNLVSSRDYTVNRGDSPASIAKKFGVSLDQLLNANPQKATTMVRGVRTWTDLSINEGLNLPKTDSAGVGFNFGHFLKSLANPLTVLDPRNLDPRHLAQTTFGGDSRKPTAMSSWQRWQKIHPHSPYSNYKRWWDTYGKKGGTINGAPGVGDYTVDAVREVAAIDPCDRANVDRVCAAQAAMGFEPDGKWGTDSYIAALGFDPNAPPGCHPRPAWWASAGRSNCNRAIVEASKALTELEAWKRAREGSGTMSGISLNGAYIPGLGLGQDPAPQGTPTAAPPVASPPPANPPPAAPPVVAPPAGGVAPHHHKLSTAAKVGIGVGAAAVVATVVVLATHKKKGRKKSRRR